MEFLAFHEVQSVRIKHNHEPVTGTGGADNILEPGSLPDAGGLNIFRNVIGMDFTQANDVIALEIGDGLGDDLGRVSLGAVSFAVSATFNIPTHDEQVGGLSTSRKDKQESEGEQVS